MQGINSNINIYSIAAIEDDQKFSCIEFFNNNDKIKFGIKILNLRLNNNSIYIFFNDNIINYSFLSHKNDIPFESKLIRNYSYSSKEVNKKSLWKIYIKKPHCSSKQKLITKENNWIFRNINSRYFCFCKGKNCNYINICQKCKYLFYLYLIDNNKKVYNKSNYLLADFLKKTKSLDDALPIFREMIKQNISAHYITEKIEIYEEYCQNEKNCLKIIPILNRKYFLDGDFFEKYFSVILKLKVVVSSVDLYSFDNIFMYIDYITYINLGHGVKFFKHFLYNRFSSHLKYDKVLLPPSEKIISVAKKYHWTDENIIKICLPRWDKYDIYKRQISLNSNIKENYKSIFLMFTWRQMKNNNKISPLYMKNILNIIYNQLLNSILINNNITLYFTLHHMIFNYKDRIKTNNEKIKFIYTNQISDCLTKCNLLITDFSSIIFDIIYQQKPYIMFIPDENEPYKEKIYSEGYANLINGLINGSIYFENKVSNISELINKVLYYVNNDFTLEAKLKKFYNSFNLKCKNNTKTFIDYLLHI